MPFDCPEKIRGLTPAQRLRFYEQLACNLTISIRGILAHPELSAEQKVDQMEWVNEIMHRVTAKISVTRLNSHDWTEESMYEMMQDYISQNEGIRGCVAWAVMSSYNYVANLKGPDNPSIKLDHCTL